MSGVQQYERPAEQLEEEKRQRRGDKLSRPTVPTAEHFRHVVQQLRDQQETGSSIDLIQFLKKTPPPPTNYMSIPDDISSSGDDRWEKLKVKVFHFRHRRRDRKRHPPPIKLPDSAVAATTIDGHRYIAISIPTEYSPWAPLHSSQYPVYDSIGTTLQRGADSKSGTWRNLSSNRLVTVLNPVAEDPESLSSSWLPQTSQPGQINQTIVTATSSRRARPHSASLLPSQEQRYTPRRVRDTTQNWSINGDRPASRGQSGSIAMHQSRGAQRISMPARTDMSASGPDGRGRHMRAIQTTETSSNRHFNAGRDIPGHAFSRRDVRESTRHVPEKPVIIFTVPSRTSSRRAQLAAPTPPESLGNVTGSQRSSVSVTGTGSRNGSSGHSSGDNWPRGSFADSIASTNSSPQLLKAQTAMAFHHVPIVVRSPGGSAGTDVDSSPLDLTSSEPGSRVSVQSSPKARVPTSPRAAGFRSRKERGCERKQRNVEKLKTQIEQEEPESGAPLELGEAVAGHTLPGSSAVRGSSEVGSPPIPTPPSMEWMRRKEKGKDMEFASQSSSFLPDLSSSLLKIQPRAFPGHHERNDTSSSSYSSLTSSPFTPTSAQSFELSPSERLASPLRQAKRGEREERKARYMAKVMAEEKETLESLSREELLQRYEALREHRIYEREKRLRKLERNRDTWVRSLPVLLENLNRLLQDQHRLLAGAGLTYDSPAAVGSSRDHHHHQHQPQHRHHHPRQQRRSRSAEVSSGSGYSTDPLGIQRPRSLCSSSESCSGFQSSRLRPAEDLSDRWVHHHVTTKT